MTEALRDDITAVPGVQAGHWTDRERLTGCTVVLTEGGAVAAVDVRGAAPGTRETALLAPGRTVDRVHAVLLAGGSAFGLAAADGVMAWLRERGAGFATAAGPVPIVPAAILYDLALGVPAHPDAAAGRAACEAAQAAESLAQGNVGAGTGATVGKLRGLDGAVKSGLGAASVRLPLGAAGEVTVGVVAAVNAFGDVCDPASGAIVAGTRAREGGWLNTFDALRAGLPVTAPAEAAAGTNTTLAVVATDAPLDGSTAYRLAQNAHDALARAIRPCHTPFDGDTVFALSTRPGPCDAGTLAMLCAAAEATLVRAILAAVRHATGAGGLPASRECVRA
ncbi:MAG TPA: P1 family peptidase [Thermomicrobiales bacterium]|jgi:L-aminopeptidase/D-esterase-like protein|nr:P1 family peptidase [Thermomicrobiales bacterium]